MRCNKKFLHSKNKNVRLSAATLLYNISFYVFSQGSDPSDIGSRVALQVDTILTAKSYETEALIRSLVALGTVALASPQSKETAKSAFVVSRVEMSASPHGDLARALAKEVYSVLS
uniref:PUL domain-containing protein n=1 Tax=Pseudo-nitzschia delicatissima TaxID=44447 RepID=A0A7S0T8U4_9STRA